MHLRCAPSMHTKTCGRAARLEHWSTAGNWSTRKLANMRTHTNIHDGREAHGREALEVVPAEGAGPHTSTFAHLQARAHTNTHMPAGKPGQWSSRQLVHTPTYSHLRTRTHKHTCQQGSLGCGPSGTHMGGPHTNLLTLANTHTHKHTCQQGSLGSCPSGTHMGGPHTN